MQAGIYQLLIHLPESASIQIGKKGRFKFPAGYYVYTGSAKGGLKGRVRRHLRKDKKDFWHIDYLLRHAVVRKVLLFVGRRRNECALARKVLSKREGSVIVPKFGSSDCGCVSHLVFFGRLKQIPSEDYKANLTFHTAR
jgi:Uri superfamily endonuclease